MEGTQTLRILPELAERARLVVRSLNHELVTTPEMEIDLRRTIEGIEEDGGDAFLDDAGELVIESRGHKVRVAGNYVELLVRAEPPRGYYVPVATLRDREIEFDDDRIRFLYSRILVDGSGIPKLDGVVDRLPHIDAVYLTWWASGDNVPEVTFTEFGREAELDDVYVDVLWWLDHRLGGGIRKASPKFDRIIRNEDRRRIMETAHRLSVPFSMDADEDLGVVLEHFAEKCDESVSMVSPTPLLEWALKQFQEGGIFELGVVEAAYRNLQRMRGASWELLHTAAIAASRGDWQTFEEMRMRAMV
jgi:hypothetical protein